jgi:DNA-binding transcriptional regulator YhcF (GntR family)
MCIALISASPWITPAWCRGTPRTLRDEGLVEFLRGRGVSVTGTAARRSPVVTKARELVAAARRYGYRPEQLAEIIGQPSWELR